MRDGTKRFPCVQSPQLNFFFIKTIAHLLECIKSQTLTTLNADKDREQQKLSFIATRNAKNTTATVKDSSAISYKSKQVLPNDPAIVLLGMKLMST